MNSLYFWLPLAGLAWVVVEMTATFAFARRVKNYGVVDVVWSLGFAPLVLIYLGLAARFHFDVKLNAYPEWNWPAALTLTALVVMWSLRLGGHLFIRVKAHHPHEDVRYAELRREWGRDEARKMLGFYLLQGGLQVVLSLPWLLTILDPQHVSHFTLGPWATVGAGLWLTGWIGESIADRQLARFRADPTRRGQVCQNGLWNYSRHPNYFFEWLIWIGYAAFSLGAPYGWLGLISPLLMGHFLVNVTGIPMTEALSVKSKGDAYREYQRTTSAFIPWFKRPSAAKPC